MLAKKEPTSLNSNTGKVCLSPSPQLLQQSVELLINLRAVPGLLRAQQDPCKGQGTSWSEVDEGLDLHCRKDIHEGTGFHLRSCQVTLTPMPSNTDVFQPYQSSIRHSSLRTIFSTQGWGFCGNIVCLSVFYLCLWWVLILMWTTDHWLNALPYCWWALTAHQFGQPCVLTEPRCTMQ